MFSHDCAGLPCQVARALKGFYANQLKFFKVGRFYGRRVQSFNSAVQGCSMSIVLVNALYAIMTRAASPSFTQVSVATFIGDAKIWGSFDFVDQLAQSFEAIKQFDVDIGQSIHPEKTQILCRRTKKGKRLKRKLSIPLPVTHQVKSLGRSQQMNRQRNSKFQKQRVSKAIDVLKKIDLLPLSSFHKGLYVHAHAHSKWVFGSEVQGFSKRDLARLRSTTCKIFTPTGNHMRSAFATVATHADVFLDPLAKWCLHVRKLSKFHPSVARKALAQVVHHPVPVSGACHGFANVLSFILSQLGWGVENPNDLTLTTPYGSLQLFALSNSAFKEWVARAARTTLMLQQKT